jgi:transposase
MIKCKNCQNQKIVKNGIVRNKQRYRCNECGVNFVEGDKRVKQSTSVKKALVLSHSLILG